jgi:hypothetical protein
MATTDRTRATASSRPSLMARLEREAKPGWLTTEFWLSIIVIVGILIAAAVVDDPDGDAGPRGDQFQAGRAWQWLAIVTVGYAVSRGLAKCAARDPYWAEREDLPRRSVKVD